MYSFAKDSSSSGTNESTKAWSKQPPVTASAASRTTSRPGLTYRENSNRVGRRSHHFGAYER